jgi:hypothetical protein
MQVFKMSLHSNLTMMVVHKEFRLRSYNYEYVVGHTRATMLTLEP